MFEPITETFVTNKVTKAAKMVVCELTAFGLKLLTPNERKKPELYFTRVAF